MKDADGVLFLQWALPRLRLRWPGFRKVRRQVYKRIDRRMHELRIPDISTYQAYLETHATEWTVLDTYCWISISRFYRDKGVYHFLEGDVLPERARNAFAQGQTILKCWSIGCAGGEEPYALALLWHLVVGPLFPTLKLSVLGTDADPRAITRAQAAWYTESSLKDLPSGWRDTAFVPHPDGLRLKEEYRQSVTLRLEDIRSTIPSDRFHLILCRNLVFTYFEEGLQRDILVKISERLEPAGALVLGSLEALPQGVEGFQEWSPKLRVYRKIGQAS